MVRTLYVDETENEDYFIVCGLLIDPIQAEKAFKIFKKKANHLPLSGKKKSELFIEFKSIMLDRSYQKLKIAMLECLNRCEYKIVYSIFEKRGTILKQAKKESVYIDMLDKIIDYFDDDISVIFDRFKKTDFDKNIVIKIGNKNNVISIESKDSRSEYGLVFVDNICSSIRMHISKANSTFYYLLFNVKEV